jgi:transglutaminase-like putative cysteine protease
MNALLWKLLRRLRPRIGWVQFALGLAVVLGTAFAASDSKMQLPVDAFFWAGLLGLLLGLWIGRPASDRGRNSTQPARAVPTANEYGSRAPNVRSNHQRSQRVDILRIASWMIRLIYILAIIAGLGALLVVAAAQVLPPAGLVSQDLVALLAWLNGVLRRLAGWADLPEVRTWNYLATSLPRFWSSLLAAPGDAERGARLIVIVGGIASGWLGALALGAALAAGRNLFAWGLPILAAIGFTTILGGGTGLELVFGLALLLLLTIVVGAQQRERSWDRKGADYSTELIIDVLTWGSGIVVLILLLAFILPTSIDNPIADLLWRDVETPSGIAVLERNIQRPRTQPKIDVSLSTLPVLELGQSLEEPPPTQVIMRIRVNRPFQPSPWPHYWRARVLNLYNGRQWTTNAHVSPFEAIPVTGQVPPDTVVQEIEDLRRDRTLIVGLADIFGLDIPAQAERLPDGAQVALTEQEAAPRYRVLSRPQELALPPRFDAPPPDMSGYLVLPRGYSQRVIDLAQVVAGERQGAYERALGLEAYLRGLPYTYQVQPLPSNRDAVEQFLFDMRQGYCTYYASAMAVMARTMGIPARIAIGYATGEYDQASGAYLIHQSDAHAWPELYINGRWLPFEPTPIRALPARTEGQDLPAPQPAPAPAEQPLALGPLIWAGVLIGVVSLVLLGVWLGRPRRPRSLVTQVQTRLERDGVRAGVPWPVGATLHEYGALLTPHAGDAAESLSEVVDLVEQARYSGRPLRGEQEGRLRRAAEHLRARLAERRLARRLW